MTTRSTGSTRVLIIDDDERLTALLTEYLAQFGFAVQAVADPESGLRALKRDPPDLIVLDVMLPDMDGFTVCRKVRESSRVPIVMLTARGDVMDRIVGLELGADDYLPKPFEPRELVARVQAVLRRGTATANESDERLRVGSVEVNFTTHSVHLDGEQLPLTSAEFELLALLVRNRGRVLTRDWIMDETRGIDWEAYDRSIDVLISRLRQKLGDDPKRPAFIRTVRGTGYSFIGAARVNEQVRDARRTMAVSVFVKLALIMLLMTVCLGVIIVFIFWWALGDNVMESQEQLAKQFARAFVETSPDLAAARRAAERINVQIRYEGPKGAWATTNELPSIEDVRQHRVGHQPPGTSFYLRDDTHGGTYLFEWGYRRGYHDIHTAFVYLFLGLLLATTLIAYVSLRFLLRPLRALSDGVARLSEGELDVVLPSGARDEFGVLTVAFNQMVGRVREMIGARDQLLLDVSHELRSPLTRLKVALELLPSGEKRQQMSADIAEMEIMISELLELERLRDGRGVRLVRQDVTAVLRDLVETFRDRTPGVRLNMGSREEWLAIDADKLRIVFRNLLENAIKYSLPDSRPVQVSIATDDATVVVRVSDDGPGIPATDIGNIFEPFFRVDRSRSKKTGGYGLGLSICKRIVEAHGGTIVVENNPTRGASFIVTLRKSASL